jgi:hypothetical protein
MAVRDTYATIEELLEAVLSVQFVTRLYDEDQPIRDNSETAVSRVEGWCKVARQPARTCARENRNVHCWKPLPNSAVKTVTENTSLCVMVICKV